MKQKLLKQLNAISKKLLYIMLLQLFTWQFAIGNDLKPQQNSMVFEQQTTGQITGKVTDKSGQPLPGVSVVIKGTSNGTVTDSNGEYQIKKTENAQTLVFSFIGMETTEINIANQSVIDVELTEESTWLNEVVAVGYGIRQKKDLTGAVSVVDVKDIANIPVAGVDQMMQGRVAGVNITGDYSPGGGVSVRVRGFSTIRNNDPLYIIDGVPVESGINMINPSDIESLQVLKDAASASIYGSRAANGVIIITTKKGLSDEATISFDTYVGVQSAANKLSPLSAQQYGDLLWKAHANDGKSPANDIYGKGSSAVIPPRKLFFLFSTPLEMVLQVIIMVQLETDLCLPVDLTLVMDFFVLHKTL